MVGKSQERRGEDFVSALKTELVFQAERRRLYLSIVAVQRHTAEKPAQKWHFLNISNIPLCM